MEPLSENNDAPTSSSPHSHGGTTSSNKEFHRQMSLPSKETLEVLEMLAKSYQELVDRANGIEADFRTGTSSGGKATTALSQVEADANRLQEKGVDSVQIAELHSGKETARALRRSLNQGLEDFFERLGFLFKEFRKGSVASDGKNDGGDVNGAGATVNDQHAKNTGATTRPIQQPTTTSSAQHQASPAAQHQAASSAHMCGPTVRGGAQVDPQVVPPGSVHYPSLSPPGDVRGERTPRRDLDQLPHLRQQEQTRQDLFRQQHAEQMRQQQLQQEQMRHQQAQAQQEQMRQQQVEQMRQQEYDRQRRAYLEEQRRAQQRDPFGIFGPWGGLDPYRGRRRGFFDM
ncbi:unnamed protein product [Amoebophrya sp. A25]|nr:unnamed protein product [Amoebophrya sp. A25]|eukprot:GSA25T00018402001.1